MQRRQFLQSTAAAAVIGSVTPSGICRAEASPAAAVPAPPQLPPETVDVNVYLGRWPFRRLPDDESGALVQMLRKQGVAEAWAGSFDALTHVDLAAVNQRLAEQCRREGEGLLVPFGSVNPRSPDWQEDLRRCQEEHGMPGIRLHPNYHQYALDDPAFEHLLELASERRLIVQLVAWMEDERHQSPLMPVPTVELGPLQDRVANLPDLQLVLLNGFSALRDRALLELMKSNNVHCDIAMAELIDPLRDPLREVGAERLLFGSYAPMFYFEAAPLKLRESALDDAQIDAICHKNARRLLPHA